MRSTEGFGERFFLGIENYKRLWSGRKLGSQGDMVGCGGLGKEYRGIWGRKSMRSTGACGVRA